MPPVVPEVFEIIIDTARIRNMIISMYQAAFEYKSLSVRECPFPSVSESKNPTRATDEKIIGNTAFDESFPRILRMSLSTR